MLRFQKQSNGKKNQSVGFYIALAVCLVAIGASAWTTFDSILSLRNSESVSPSSTHAVNQPVSGIPASSTIPQPSSEIPSRTPESRAPASSQTVETNHPVSSMGPPAVSSAAPPSSAAPVTPTTYILPVNGRILKPYGTSLYSRTFGDWRAHNGVDIAANSGCNVLAIGDGTVQDFYTDVMLGSVLVVRHGDLDVYYCGLGNNPSVKVGDTVRGGQVLGILSDIPSETVEDTHLHLQIKQNGQWVEPLAAIGKENLLPSETNASSGD